MIGRLSFSMCTVWKTFALKTLTTTGLGDAVGRELSMLISSLVMNLLWIIDPSRSHQLNSFP